MYLKVEQEITEALKLVVGKDNASLHEPSFDEKEYLYLKDCIQSGYVSSIGNYVNTFSERLKDITKAKYVIPVINGTSGLHISLIVSGVKADDEVLIPTLSFVATSNAVTYVNATPHFIDVEECTLGMDPYKLKKYLETIVKKNKGYSINKKTGKRISCMIPMHTFGHACNLIELKKVAKEFNIKIIEDSAESLGTFYKNKHTGTHGLMGVLSFNGNKIITTGGGGAILTNNKLFAKKALHLSTTSKIKHKWEFIHDEIGYNYRMPNLNAALGCAQLEKLGIFLKNKRNLYEKYKSAFSNFENLKIFDEPSNSKSNYWLNTIILSDKIKHKKNSIISYTNENGIGTRPAWKLLHTLKPFKKFPRSKLKTSSYLFEKIINIPSSHFLHNNQAKVKKFN